MWTGPYFRSLLIMACLLFSASSLFAQPPIGGTKHDHPDAHVDDSPLTADERPFPLPRHRSLASTIIQSAGFTGLLILAAGAFCFVVTVLIVIRGQGPFASTTLLFVVPIPLLLGLFGLISSMVASFSVIALSDAEIKSYELCGALVDALVNPMLGLFMMTPSYLVATLGSIFRSFPKPPVKM